MDFKELRKKSKLSVKEVADKLGRKPLTVYKYESSFRLPPFHILSQMAEIYKVDLNTITEVYNEHKEKYEKRCKDERGNFRVSKKHN